MKKFLIIQTAFIGDVILASAIIEKIKAYFPDSKIDFVLRKGNESLLNNHPLINKVIVWDKKNGKFKNLINLIFQIRKIKYDYLINLQRYASSGLISFFAKAVFKSGFDKNPFSFCFTHKIKHEIGNGKHEIERNQLAILEITDDIPAKPKLYPSESDKKVIKNLLIKYNLQGGDYFCIAPASIWYTKQFPEEKWRALIDTIGNDKKVFLLGAISDNDLCERLSSNTAINLAGKINLLQSAELMKYAIMNFVNDSAPLHLASASNAPVTAIYCSTIPDFGFGPLSDKSYIVQTQESLSCRPCGLHGYNKCPEKHFKCAHGILIEKLVESIY